MPRGIYFIFLAVGLAITGGSSFYYAYCWSQVLDGRSWPSTQGVIRAIGGVEEHVGHDNDGHATYTYYPRLTYSYRVANRELSGDRIWLSGNQFYQHREDAEAFVGNYRIGQPVPVVYAPDAPEEAALLIEDPPWQILLLTAVGLGWIALTMGFRLLDRDTPERRYGRCRKCGKRLPFDEHMPDSGAAPAGPEGAAAVPACLPCPRCGQADPLNSWRNKKGALIFLAVFAAIWVGLFWLFFA